MRVSDGVMSATATNCALDSHSCVSSLVDYYNLPKDVATPEHLAQAGDNIGYNGAEGKLNDGADGALLQAQVGARESGAEFVSTAPHQPPPIRDPDLPWATAGVGGESGAPNAVEPVPPRQTLSAQVVAPATTPVPAKSSHNIADAAGEGVVPAIAPGPRPDPPPPPPSAEQELGAVLEGMEALLRGSTAESDDTSSQVTGRDARGTGQPGPPSVSRGGSGTAGPGSGPRSATGVGTVHSTTSVPALSPSRGSGAATVASEPPPAKRSPLQRLPPRYTANAQPSVVLGQGQGRSTDIECGAPTVRAYEQLRRRKVSNGSDGSNVSSSGADQERLARAEAAVSSYLSCFRDEPEPGYEDLHLGGVAARDRASTDEEEGKVAFDPLDEYEAVDSRCGWRSPRGPALGQRQGPSRGRGAEGRRGADRRGVWDQLSSSCTVS